MPPPSLRRRPQCRPQAADGFRPQLGALKGHVLPCPDAGKPCEGLRFARPGRRSFLNRSPWPRTRPSGGHTGSFAARGHRTGLLGAQRDPLAGQEDGCSGVERQLCPGREGPSGKHRGTAWSAGLVPVSLRHGSVCPGHSRWCKQLRVRLHATAKRHAPRPPRPAGPGPTRLTRRRRRLPLRPWISFLCFCCSPVRPST